MCVLLFMLYTCACVTVRVRDSVWELVNVREFGVGGSSTFMSKDGSSSTFMNRG